MTLEEAIHAALARGASAVADATLRYPAPLASVLIASIRAQTQAEVEVLRMSRVSSGTCAPASEPLKPMTVAELRCIMQEVVS